jgi:NAD(P)H-flavin reductase
VVELVAGYQAQRSYSIASAPEDDLVELTVERLDDGEVSPYLTDVLEPGDELELRGLRKRRDRARARQRPLLRAGDRRGGVLRQVRVAIRRRQTIRTHLDGAGDRQ